MGGHKLCFKYTGYNQVIPCTHVGLPLGNTECNVGSTDHLEVGVVFAHDLGQPLTVHIANE